MCKGRFGGNPCRPTHFKTLTPMQYDLIFIDWHGHCHVFECETLGSCYHIMEDAAVDYDTHVRDFIIVAHV